MKGTKSKEQAAPDRKSFLTAGVPSIRDVIAFPKTTTGQCLLTEAPAEVSDAQLAELHIAKAGKALTKEADAIAAAEEAAAELKRTGGMAGAFKSRMR